MTVSRHCTVETAAYHGVYNTRSSHVIVQLRQQRITASTTHDGLTSLYNWDSSVSRRLRHMTVSPRLYATPCGKQTFVEFTVCRILHSSHHLNTLDTASPSPLYLKSSCAKTSLTSCYSIMIYINVSQKGLYFVYIDAHFVCLYCMPTFSLSTLRLTTL